MINTSNKNGAFKAVAILLATASIAGLGAVTVAATPIGDTLSDCFTGNNGETVSGATEIHTKSDKVNVEVVSVEGDNANAVGCIRLTNSDGTSFMNEDYFLEYGYEDSFSAERYQNMMERLVGPKTSEPIVDASFYPETNDSIMLYFRYITIGNNSPIGETLKISSHTVTAVHPIKTVYIPQENDGKSELSIDATGYSSMIFTTDIYKELEETYKEELNQGYILRPSEDGNSIILANTKKIELNFTISLKFDYCSSDTISLDPRKATVSGAEWDINSLNITPTSMRLQAQTNDSNILSIPAEPNVNDYVLWTSEDGSTQTISEKYETDCGKRQIMLNNLFGDLEIKLSDGRTITAKKANFGDCGNNTQSGVTTSIDTPYFYYENERPVSIIPDEIQTISAHGIMINK